VNGLPHIQVACAIIEQNGKVMAAQRGGDTSRPFKWEFPGGKLRPGETPVECLHRELAEELGVSVDIRSVRPLVTHAYPELVVTLHPFVWALCGGRPRNREHRSLAWLRPENLPTLDWSEADRPVLADYCADVRRERTGAVP